MSGGDVRISVLGAFHAEVDGRPAAVGGGLSRALVARLALADGRRLTTSQLVADLWSEVPETAAATLRVYLSRLRSGPLGPAILGGRGGYALATADVDLLRFHRAVAEARSADDEAAHELLLAALTAWDEALADLDDVPFAATERDRAAEARRSALERLAETSVAVGRPGDAVAALTRGVQDAPLDEALSAALARVLAAAGRTAEALAVLDEQATAAAAAGLDQGARAAELRQSILRSDSSVSVPEAHAVERHGIPVPLTAFVGRERELAELERVRAEQRLVTIAGPGGAGKTRLAVESARRATRTIDAEQWLVDLTAVEREDAVLRSVAEAVGAVDATLDAMVARLSRAPGLLILDNAEHLVRAVRGLVVDLLGRASGLSILVTSREPVGVPGEFVLRVTGLGPEAAELLRQRVTEVRGGREPSADELPAIRRLCRLVDGLPLALELAAARADVLSLDEVDATLRDDEDVPVVDARDRHRSLASTLRWSAGLLSDAELDVFVQVSGFAGPFTLDAAEAVCTAPEGLGLRAAVVALARKSLIAVEQTDRGTRRYRLLETAREFARPLRDPAGLPAWNRRHRLYFAALAEQLAPRVRTHEAAEAHDAFDSAAPDLQLASETAIAEGDRETAVRISAAQAWHWFKRGLLLQGRASIEKALALPGGAAPEVEAAAFAGLVNLAYQSGDAEAAFGFVSAGIERATEAGDDATLSSLLAYAAYGHSLLRDPGTAVRLAEQAEQLSATAPEWVRSEVLMSRGQMLRALGRPAEALESLGRARTLAARTGHAWAQTSSEYVIGKVLIDVRRPREAIRILYTGARTALRGGDPTGALALLHLMGGAAARIERHREGAMLFGGVDEIGMRYGYNPVAAEGDDARRHRELTAAGLSADAFADAYAAGRRLDFDGMMDLASTIDR